METTFVEGFWGLPVGEDMELHLDHLRKRLKTSYSFDVVECDWAIVAVDTGGAVCPVTIESIAPIGAELARPKHRERYDEPIEWITQIVRPSWKRLDLQLGALTLLRSRPLDPAGVDTTTTGVLIKDLMDELADIANAKLDKMRWKPRGIMIFEEPKVRVGVDGGEERVRMDTAFVLAAGIRLRTEDISGRDQITGK